MCYVSDWLALLELISNKLKKGRGGMGDGRNGREYTRHTHTRREREREQRTVFESRLGTLSEPTYIGR